MERERVMSREKGHWAENSELKAEANFYLDTNGVTLDISIQVLPLTFKRKSGFKILFWFLADCLYPFVVPP